MGLLATKRTQEMQWDDGGWLSVSVLTERERWVGSGEGTKGEGKTLRRYCDGSDHSFLFMHGYKCCFCLYCSVSNIHRSATTSKPLTGDVNNLAGIYVNATWQRTTHPNFVVDLITTTHYQWQWPPPAGQCALTRHKHCSGPARGTQ